MAADRYFTDIKKMDNTKERLKAIIRYKSEVLTLKELKIKHYKEYQMYKEKEKESREKLMKSIPDEM